MKLIGFDKATFGGNCFITDVPSSSVEGTSLFLRFFSVCNFLLLFLYSVFALDITTGIWGVYSMHFPSQRLGTTGRRGEGLGY